MQGQEAIEHVAQYCGKAFMNQIEDAIYGSTRGSEVIDFGLKDQDGKFTRIRVTIVTEPQIFGKTKYGNIESSVTHGMKVLEKNNETTIPKDSLF